MHTECVSDQISKAQCDATLSVTLYLHMYYIAIDNVHVNAAQRAVATNKS